MEDWQEQELIDSWRDLAGCEIQDGNVLCPECGNPLWAEEEHSEEFLSQEGTYIVSQTGFCDWCGYSAEFELVLEDDGGEYGEEIDREVHISYSE